MQYRELRVPSFVALPQMNSAATNHARFGVAAMAEADHPSVGGQRTVCSAHATRFGASCRSLRYPRLRIKPSSAGIASLSRGQRFPFHIRRSGPSTTAASVPARALQASYVWLAVVHTEQVNMKVLRSAISPGVTAKAARPNPSIEGTCNIRLRRLSPAPHVKR